MVALRKMEAPHRCLGCEGTAGPFGFERGRLKSRCNPCLRVAAMDRRRAAGMPEVRRRVRHDGVWCSDCKAYIDPSNFWRNRSAASGYYAKCKIHHRATRTVESPEKRRERYAANREAMKAARRESYLRHQEATRAAERARYHARKQFGSVAAWRAFCLDELRAESMFWQFDRLARQLADGTRGCE